MPTRFVMTQPSLASYRLGVFRELASRPGIDFKLYYAEQPGVRNVEPEGFEAEFVAMKRLPGGAVWYPPHLWATKRGGADVVCLPWNPYHLSVFPALRAGRRHGVGTFLWGHGYSKNERPWRATIRRWMASKADGAVFYNHAIRDRSVSEGWLADERAFVALNALDQAPIQAARDAWLGDPGRLDAFRREHGLGEGPNIIFVSRLLPENRADLMVEAAARLKDDLPNSKFIIVGSGPAEDDLRAKAEALGVADRLVMPGAIWGEDAIAPWYLSSHAFVYPANIGLSILHAMGYGVPVITSDRTETQNPEIEALRDGENGRLYPHLDADALARTIREVVSDESARSKMATAAHETATRRFTVKRMADGFEQAIRYCDERARRRR
ncbi:MAG: glycosyltransferase family 4 protein [Phycisphaerales bacterium]